MVVPTGDETDTGVDLGFLISATVHHATAKTMEFITLTLQTS